MKFKSKSTGQRWNLLKADKKLQHKSRINSLRLSLRWSFNIFEAFKDYLTILRFSKLVPIFFIVSFLAFLKFCTEAYHSHWLPYPVSHYYILFAFVLSVYLSVQYKSWNRSKITLNELERKNLVLKEVHPKKLIFKLKKFL